MQNIWAPWRSQYFSIEKGGECVFCMAASQRDPHGQSSSDDKTFVLIRDRTCFALLNAYPYSGGHLMVAPYRHTGALEDLTEDELKDLMVLSRRCKGVLEKAFKPDGFNIGFNIGKPAGAGIPGHLHLHVVPRWTGDTNFMPVLAGTRVVSVGLEETYARFMEQMKE